jgi:hypothetical protein
MTQPPQPTEPFAQHPRLAELVTALGSGATRCPDRAPLRGTGRPPKTLLDEFRRLADRHQRGFMVEHIMELLVTS